MSEKLLNELYAKRATASTRIREMISTGVKPEDQEAFDKANKDFQDITGQIQSLNNIEAAERAAEKIIDIEKPVDGRNGFMNYVRYGDPSAIIQNAVGSGTSSAGYLVPTELKKEIIKIMYDWGAIINLADVITTDTTTDIPVDGTAPTAYWIDEAGAFTDSSPTVGKIQLGANKVGAMIKVADELLQDSAFNVEAYIDGLAGEALGRAAEQEFINGTVSGRPVGILTSASQALTSSVTNSFNYANILSLYTGVATPYANRGSWLVERTTLATLMGLTDGASHLVFQPAYAAGAPDLLLGRPLVTSEKMPTLTTTAKGVVFGDFKYYKIGLRGGMAMKRLEELYAGNGQVGFRISYRVDGKLGNTSAIKSMACL